MYNSLRKPNAILCSDPVVGRVISQSRPNDLSATDHNMYVRMYRSANEYVVSTGLVG